MKYMFKNLFRVLFLATLMVAATNCTKQDDDVIATAVQATLTAGVQATWTAEGAINAAVETRVHATQNAMQASVPPTETVIQPTMTPENNIEATLEALNATQTAMSAPELPSEPSVEPSAPVAISSPADGSTAPQYNEVSGVVKRTALAGKFLNIIVATRTGEFWVQKEPTVEENGNWVSYPVILGTISIGNGESFQICVVIADQQLSEGRIYSFPAGPKACSTITRKD